VGIALGGINTGLPPNLVDQLVEMEKEPIKTIEKKKEKTQAKLTLVNELDEKLKGILGTLGELTGTKGFTDIVVTSGDPNIISGTADPSASVNGSWNVEVMELANKASALSNGFPDKDKTQLGVGYFKFETPEGEKQVYIDGNNNTLDKAAKTINQAGLNVQATVIKDNKDASSPFRLMISGVSVGAGNAVQYPTLYFLDGDQDFYFDEERPAKNGKVKVDGFEIEVDANKLDDIVPGVTLDLKQAAPGKSINVGVAENKEVISGKIKTFVEKTNAVLSFIQSQNKVGEKTDTTKTLGGDSMLRSVENEMRRMIQGVQMGVGGEIKTLNQIGITFNRNGTIDLDQAKFDKVLSQKSGDVKAFFVGDNFNTGFVPTVKNTIARISSSAFGPLGNKRKSLMNEIQQADQRIENLTRNVEMKEKNLRRKFANLEETMAKVRSQGNVLTERLGGSGPAALNFGGMSKTGDGV
jgi:flagellar hook-associated protein 2